MYEHKVTQLESKIQGLEEQGKQRDGVVNQLK